jgi:hypothetical protein
VDKLMAQALLIEVTMALINPALLFSFSVSQATMQD